MTVLSGLITTAPCAPGVTLVTDAEPAIVSLPNTATVTAASSAVVAESGCVSCTVIVMVSRSVSQGDPLSVTVKLSVYVPGPCVAAGVQRNRPLCAFRVAPAGNSVVAPSSLVALKRSVLAGTSGSLAVAVNDSSLPSKISLFPIAFSTGGRLTSYTVMLIVSESVSCGSPLSATQNRMPS